MVLLTLAASSLAGSGFCCLMEESKYRVEVECRGDDGGGVVAGFGAGGWFTGVWLGVR